MVVSQNIQRNDEENKPYAGTLPFIDLKAQQSRIQDKVEQRIKAVLEHGNYIMGPEVYELEEKLASYTGAKHVISCSNGTDALWLPLLALGIGANDAVFVPSFTFAATAEAVALCGASPVFIDVCEDTFNMSPESLERTILDIIKRGELTPKAIIVVDLFGLPADYEKIHAIALRHGLTVIADAAQSFGGSYLNQKVGTLARINATSFFPAKPLGCYGDGGAMFVEDSEMNEILLSLRVHGRGVGGKYDNVRVGTNARLDTLQAAILLEKMAIFPEELEMRQSVASFYSAHLKDIIETPRVPEGYVSAWAQYTLKSKKRNEIIASLKEKGIPTQIYYPKPIHMHIPYQGYPLDPQGLPITEKLATEVFSLPMHPYLKQDIQQYIVEAIRNVNP